MIKKTVTYEDFAGNKVTEDCYFNLTETELLELQFRVEGGWGEWLQSIVDSNDVSQIFKEFKFILGASYGVRSEDGRSFHKSDTIREHFLSSLAFNEIVLSFFQNPTAASDFVSQLIPKERIDRLKALASEESARPEPQDRLKKLDKPQDVAATRVDDEEYLEWRRQRELGSDSK